MKKSILNILSVVALLATAAIFFACDAEESLGTGNAEVRVYGGDGEDFSGPAVFFTSGNDLQISIGDPIQLNIAYLLQSGENVVPVGEYDVFTNPDPGQATATYTGSGVHVTWAGFLWITESSENKIVGELDAGFVKQSTQDTVMSLTATFTAVRSSLN